MNKLRSLQDEAYEYLKEKIIHRELEYGEFYSERKMANCIGISRTPFKDALVRLSQDRYVDIVPGKGFCLHELSYTDISNIYQTRTAIEGYCALFLHTRRRDKESVAVIRAIENDLEQMEQAVFDKAPYSKILRHDFDFHRRIVEFSNNANFIRLFESHQYHLFEIARKTFEFEGRLSEAAKEHREIYKQIITDANVGVDTFLAVMRHMNNTKDIALMLQS